eukprot:scaffold263586_cov31-Tisochrysis_lutea.AAC.1
MLWACGHIVLGMRALLPPQCTAQCGARGPSLAHSALPPMHTARSALHGVCQAQNALPTGLSPQCAARRAFSALPTVLCMWDKGKERKPCLWGKLSTLCAQCSSPQGSTCGMSFVRFAHFALLAVLCM